MIQIPKDFKEFIQLLNVHEVEYVVIGGYAVAIYGYVRYTGDELFMDEGKILRVGTEPMRLEVLNQIDGVTFDECFSNRRELLIDA